MSSSGLRLLSFKGLGCGDFEIEENLITQIAERCGQRRDKLWYLEISNNNEQNLTERAQQTLVRLTVEIVRAAPGLKELLLHASGLSQETAITLFQALAAAT